MPHLDPVDARARTSRRRRSSTGCWWSRTRSRWRTASRPCPVPRQRARRHRATYPGPAEASAREWASTSCGRRCAALLPQEIVAEAEAGIQPTRPVLVPRADDALHPGDAARPTHARRVVLPADASSDVCSASTSRAKVNHRLLIWSLLCFEWWNRLFIDGDPTARHDLWHTSRTAPARRET